MRGRGFQDERLKLKCSEMSFHEKNENILDNMLELKCSEIEEPMIKTNETKQIIFVKW